MLNCWDCGNDDNKIGHSKTQVMGIEFMGVEFNGSSPRNREAVFDCLVVCSGRRNNDAPSSTLASELGQVTPIATL